MELLDVYSSDKEKTGKILPREDIFEKINENERILLVHACIFNSKHEMLIQQRQFDKDRYPGCWDVSAGGFVMSGESSSDAVFREVKEELGLNVREKNPIFVCCEPFGKVLDDFYRIVSDIEFDRLCIQKEELASVKWSTEKEIIAMIDRGDFVDYSKNLISRLFRESR